MNPDKLFNLRGRVALVTGGGTGIGWMIAKGLAGCGAKVYISGRRKDVLENSAHSFQHGMILPLAMDVTDKESILSSQKEIQEREGKLHILVNNAGITGPVSHFFNDLSSPEHQNAETLGLALFNNESFDSWNTVYSANTFSVFFVTTAFLGLLAKGSSDVPGYKSSVVNITSISGIGKLAQNHFGYNSAKAAASHLTKMLATELILKNIPVRVCAVAPGVYESEMTNATITSDMVDKVSLGIVPVPEKRPGTAEEVAGTVVYLVSQAGGYTNGQEIIVDGGCLAVNPSTA